MRHSPASAKLHVTADRLLARRLPSEAACRFRAATALEHWLSRRNASNVKRQGEKEANGGREEGSRTRVPVERRKGIEGQSPTYFIDRDLVRPPQLKRLCSGPRHSFGQAIVGLVAHFQRLEFEEFAFGLLLRGLRLLDLTR